MIIHTVFFHQAQATARKFHENNAIQELRIVMMLIWHDKFKCLSPSQPRAVGKCTKFIPKHRTKTGFLFSLA